MTVDHPLLTTRALYRALLWRLGLAAAVLALVIGTFAYLSLRDRFIELVSAVARVEAVRLNEHFLPLLDSPSDIAPATVQHHLDLLAGRKSADLEQGHFIVLHLFDRSGRLLASIEDRNDPEISGIKTALKSAPLQSLENRPDFFRLDGRSFVLIAQPMTDSQGQPVMEAAGVFAASPAALGYYRWQIVRTLLFTLGVILATALVLYPLLRKILDRVFSLSHELLLANLDTIKALGSAIAKRDSDTDDHNYRVALYCMALGEALAMPRPAVLGLIKGAFLHDIGKIGIHDQILLKPGRLDAEEFAEMKKHVDYGLEIVSRVRWLSDAVDVVGRHHEKFDGSGYPAGLKGEDIPLNARIFAVTDVFDALTSRRPYKEPLPIAKCLEILEESRGNHFDPALVDTFIGLAEDLYARYGSGSPESLREAMRVVQEKYFEPAATLAR